ncbi:MAG: Lcl C-terminal domain-containing protein [Polyangiales bacterium]
MLTLRTLVSTAAGAFVVMAGHGPARAGAPPGRYSAGTDADGTAWVKDLQTGLTWKRDVEPGSFGWSAALSKCSTPWRLPVIRELLSLVSPSEKPTLDAASFPGPATFLWSSTKYALVPGKAWVMGTSSGSASGFDVGIVTEVVTARCVR